MKRQAHEIMTGLIKSAQEESHPEPEEGIVPMAKIEGISTMEDVMKELMSIKVQDNLLRSKRFHNSSLDGDMSVLSENQAALSMVMTQ
jgi:hypothetical protein